MMARKPTYEELGRKVKELEKEVVELRQVEKELKQNEHTYRYLAENVDSGISMIDPNHNIIWVNRTIGEWFDKDPNEFVGKKCYEEFEKKGEPCSYCPGIKAMATGRPCEVETQGVRSDGSRFTVRDRSFPLYSIDGELIGFHEIVEDITEKTKLEEELNKHRDHLEKLVEERTLELSKSNERLKTKIEEHKRVGESLRESENFFTQMFVQSKTSTQLFDPDGNCIRVNPEFCNLFGVTEKDITGGYNVFNDQAAIDSGVIPLVRQIFEDKKTNKWQINFDIETASVSTNTFSTRKEKIWIDVLGYPVLDKNSSLQYVVLQHYDITERNKTYEALRESEVKYRRIFENIQDVYYESSLDGTIVEISPSVENISQYNREELIGMSLYDIYTNPKERGEFLKLIQDKGKINDFEISLTDKDGSKRPCSITTLLVKDEHDNPVKLVGSMRDISERKQNEEKRKKLEAQLQQAQKMEAIGTLAGGIAHDFNNLLMAIQGRASILLMNKDSSHPDIKHLKGIEDNIESASDLTSQLLGFARGGKYEVKPTDINELIKKQNRMFGRTRKEITIRGKYEEDPWSVEVDRGQIEQVLLNLYINAWQAMPGGGHLYLETENVALDENYVKQFSIEPGRYVKISVVDTGTGMDKATREKIFEPFFTTKEMGRGTGLGLASVYGIIRNHGGYINVYSEKGHGTTFSIYLPATDAEGRAQGAECEGEGEIIRGRETVLFVDDEDMIIEIAEEIFKQLGYKVLTARSGKEAIEIYKENKGHIDLVLLDMIMPDMSGSDTYDRMKDIDPKVKVLLSSGYSINGKATEIMDRGCDGFIQKPFKMKELSQKLREILDGK